MTTTDRNLIRFQWLRSSSRSLANHNLVRCLLASLFTLLVLPELRLQLQPNSASGCVGAQMPVSSSLKFDTETNSYSGLTFTFDPRLDKRVEWLHFEHWLNIMHSTSNIIHEALNSRAHLAEIRVLIPYKWRQQEWPVLHKPGSPIITNRRLRFVDSDVIVGFEGLNIHMPISFLDQNSNLPNDPALKGRLLAREFASYRYGIFKESGFRYDFAYPPFVSLAGQTPVSSQNNHLRSKISLQLSEVQWTNGSQSGDESSDTKASVDIRGFDESWNECNFETSPANGLPLAKSANCVPYLIKTPATSSLNLMSSDPFSYSDLRSSGSHLSDLTNQVQPISWRDLSDTVKWHFCGQNFAASQKLVSSNGDLKNGTNYLNQNTWFQHNNIVPNKQNKMCNERSALDVIRANEDFSRVPSSPSSFNVLPTPNFKFLQEMPTRMIICVEYGAHLYQSRRLDYGILQAAMAKLLTFDLIPESEFALVLFGQQQSARAPFKKVGKELNPALYVPNIDPFEEPAKLYTDIELAQMDIQAAKIVKGSCSFVKLMGELSAALAQRNQYDDLGADIIIITSGLFIENETKIEETFKSLSINNNQFKIENLQINLIIYPSTLLFDTKSRDGFVILNAVESERIIKQRINKLLLIQRLTNAKIHLVKEHLDVNGDVKMSTLAQFHLIFEQITKGHSWDQTQSTLIIAQQTIDSRTNSPVQNNYSSYQNKHNQHVQTQQANYRLEFNFELDSSIQNELFVGFIEPKLQSQSKIVKMFALKNLELRSPNGKLVFTDSHPWIKCPTFSPNYYQDTPTANDMTNAESDALSTANSISTPEQIPNESTLFAYRPQLSLAGFHLKEAHLSYLNTTRQLSGIWTLSATADEGVQASGVAMARVNPAGDSIVATCWVQTYYTDPPDSMSSPQLKAVKVFMQTKSGPNMGPIQDISARMEVQDETGDIVQNVNMLDDGIGSPDMTRGDGIYSQYVQRTYRPGFYRVTVEVSGREDYHGPFIDQPKQRRDNPTKDSKDNACCGSFVPQSKQPDTKHLSRLLYCGTFNVAKSNILSHQKPPRVNNLTIIDVDQDSRQVTIRWFEPSIDISIRGLMNAKQQLETPSDANGYSNDDTQFESSSSEQMALVSSDLPKSDTQSRYVKRHSNAQESGSNRYYEDEQPDAEILNNGNVESKFSGVTPAQKSGSPKALIVNGPIASSDNEYSQLFDRYEIKLFSDRNIMKRAFDAKHEVGFRFNLQNIVGSIPNVSSYGGMKEVTLRIPNGREGIYYIAMKVYNNIGMGSSMSNIVEFYMKSSLSGAGADLLDGQATSIDPFNQRISGHAIMSTNLLRFSTLMAFTVIAFLIAILLVTLFGWIAHSALYNALGKRRTKSPVVTLVADSHVTNTGSESSVTFSKSSQEGESGYTCDNGSQETGGKDREARVDMYLNQVVNRVSPVTLQQMQMNQQHNEVMMNQRYEEIYYDHEEGQLMKRWWPMTPYGTDQSAFEAKRQEMVKEPIGKSFSGPQHTLVNGFPYATVQSIGQQQQMANMTYISNIQQQVEILPKGDLNEIGLGEPAHSRNQMINQYDHLKHNINELTPDLRLDRLTEDAQCYGCDSPAYDNRAYCNTTDPSKQSGVIPVQLGGYRLDDSDKYPEVELQKELQEYLERMNRGKTEEEPELSYLTTSGSVVDLPPVDLKENQELIACPSQYVACGDNGLPVPTNHYDSLGAGRFNQTIYSDC